MSKMSETARAAAKSKVDRLMRTDPKAKVDASSYTPPDALDADIKTGMRPVSPRQFKKGGKVAGAAHVGHAGRKPRKSGGRTEMPTVDRFINKDLKKANEYREGEKHIGGMKKGGRTKKMDGGSSLLSDPTAPDKRSNIVPSAMLTFGPGGQKSPVIGLKKGGAAKWEGSAKDEAQDKKLAKKHGMSMKAWEASKMDEKHDKQQSTKGLKKGGRAGMSVSDGEIEGTRPTGGRLARKHGGKAGKTAIHINIGGGGAHPPMSGAPMGGPPPGGPPMGPPPGAGAPPPMGMPPGGPPPGAGGPPGLPPGLAQLLQGRKAGGRTYPKMKYGAGSGEGRLEKIEEYGGK